jgi:hypothetical protein
VSVASATNNATNISTNNAIIYIIYIHMYVYIYSHTHTHIVYSASAQPSAPATPSTTNNATNTSTNNATDAVPSAIYITNKIAIAETLPHSNIVSGTNIVTST